MSGIAERLAEVLAEHREDYAYPDSCTCEDAIPNTRGGHFAAHVAQALLPVVEREIAAARGEALREAEVAALALTTVTNPWSPDRLGRGICPKCREDKFIGHGPLCWECFAGSGESEGA